MARRLCVGGPLCGQVVETDDALETLMWHAEERLGDALIKLTTSHYELWEIGLTQWQSKMWARAASAEGGDLRDWTADDVGVWVLQGFDLKGALARLGTACL